MVVSLLSDEAALLARLKAGDEAAFMAVVEAWGPGMLRLARAHVSSQAVAEEVVQEAWVGILRGLDRFEGRSSLKTWAFRIVSNTAKTRGVKESRTIPISSIAGDRDDEGGPSVDPERFFGDGS
jgi:RNA polymerase sigma-70 factor (ECF subfamily)